MTETIRELLERREVELQNQINEMHGKLAPLEAELADVRKARAAISSPIISGVGTLTADAAVLPTGASPYASLTMKELAIRALRDHFPSGATANQLLEFFKNAWARDIPRPSFSPQLTRLKTEGKIDRRGLIWRLIGPQTAEAPTEAQSESASDLLPVGRQSSGLSA
jgi:hypothetical protein